MVRRAMLVIVMVVLLLPIWFMFTGSLQDIHGVMTMPPRLLPLHATLDNFGAIFGRGTVLRWAINTAVVAAFYVCISVTISVTAGYAFSFYEFRFKKVLWLLLLAGIMLPRISMFIPLFVVVRRLGISGGFLAVTLPVAFSPVGMYLARTYFGTVPNSLLESARIDGANELQILMHVVAPISKPIITALALFSSIGALGDYMWQMLQLQDERLQTLVVGLTRMTMQRSAADMQINPLGRAMAGGVILLIPLLVIFCIANRHFVSALGGAVKE